MVRRGTIAATLAAAAFAALGGFAGATYHGGMEPGPGGGTQGAEKEPAAHVDAAGNPFSGGLAFDPAEVAVEVTDVVKWTNTDSAVPHTATEDHMLWQLSGEYGDPAGAFPKGFAPGETVSRDFDAGTWSYFCEVHPEDMHGIVKVPVRLSERKGKVVGRWGSGPLPEGQVFDVQRKRGKGPWRKVEDGTTEARGKYPGGREGTRWAFRARVREAEDPAASSGWSPPARVKLG